MAKKTAEQKAKERLAKEVRGTIAFVDLTTTLAVRNALDATEWSIEQAEANGVPKEECFQIVDKVIERSRR